MFGHFRVKLLTTAEVVKAVVGQLTHPAAVYDTVGALQSTVTAEFTLMQISQALKQFTVLLTEHIMIHHFFITVYFVYHQVKKHQIHSEASIDTCNMLKIVAFELTGYKNNKYINSGWPS